MEGTQEIKEKNISIQKMAENNTTEIRNREKGKEKPF